MLIIIINWGLLEKMEVFMSSSFFKPFIAFFTVLCFLIFFLSCFFGPNILLDSSNLLNDTYYSFNSNAKYLWPTPRLYFY